MKINALVVKALLELQELDFGTLARMAHVARAELEAWLYQGSEAAQDRIPAHRRIEILNLLGIRDGVPRSDVVHHWKVVEPFFGSTEKLYWSLITLTRAFGAGRVVYFSPETSPALRFSNENRFGIQFNGFHVVLTVQGHPMRSSRFDPERIEGLSWMPGAAGILLESPEYSKLLPGYVEVEQFNEHIDIAQEDLAWSQVSSRARSIGVKPSMLIDWVSQQAALSPPAPGAAAGAAPEAAKVTDIQDRLKPSLSPVESPIADPRIPELRVVHGLFSQ